MVTCGAAAQGQADGGEAAGGAGRADVGGDGAADGEWEDLLGAGCRSGRGRRLLRAPWPDGARAASAAPRGHGPAAQTRLHGPGDALPRRAARLDCGHPKGQP
jgi:hypothetical protein